MAELLLLLIILSSWSNFIYAALSGIYIDNGFDQTIMDKKMSENELHEFKLEMAELLGLPTKLRRKRKTSISESSAPKFLLDIYNSLEGTGSEYSIRNEFNLREEDIKTIADSDSIMTFLMKDKVHHDKKKTLWFDVSSVRLDSTILGAELRLFKFPGNDVEKYTVTIYQIMTNLKGENELGYVDAVNVTSTYEGWMIFNVTSPFQSWITFPSTNQGLHISIHKQHSPGHAVNSEMAGLISSGVAEGMEHRQPFMVAFFKNESHMRKSRRRRRQIMSNRKSENNSYENFKRRIRRQTWQMRTCQRQTMYVSFRDLNWQEWVIAPDGFAAYFCSGVCEFPLSTHMNATNHAIVETLAHLLDLAPKPACCAPNSYTTLSLLHYLDDSAILKKFKNMIVTSCGCL